MKIELFDFQEDTLAAYFDLNRRRDCENRT